MRMTHYKSGFTRSELMVVMGILALFLGIVHPVLSSGGRDHARDMVCLAHLHQAGQAVLLYAEDNSDFMPPYSSGIFQSTDESWTGPDGVVYTQYRRHALITAWFKSGPYQGGPRDGDGFLGPYLGTSEPEGAALLGCPSVPIGPTWVEATYLGSWIEGYTFQAYTFGWNLGAATYGGHPGYLDPLPVSILSQPDAFVTLAEGLGMAFYILPGLDPDDSTLYTPPPRHQSQFNASFADGHAEGGTLAELHTSEHFCIN